ncbi:MAG: hypothetical protein H3C51_00600 [Rubellimicrobium sp.]|nr:hypothetical protein [Rubellimicrobium sp.]
MTALPEPLTQRRLTPDDAPAVRALHEGALSLLARPDWVRPERPGFFAPVLAEGLSLGLFDGGQLVGYALMQGRLEAGDNPAATPGMAGLPMAKLCGCTVAPHWRGHGLQARLARERLRIGRTRGWRGFFATAAPGNVPSWHSLLRAGLAIGQIGRRYSGALRYTLVLTQGRATGPGRSVGADDLPAQAMLLDQGWRGISRDGAGIVFRRWVRP